MGERESKCVGQRGHAQQQQAEAVRLAGGRLKSVDN